MTCLGITDLNNDWNLNFRFLPLSNVFIESVGSHRLHILPRSFRDEGSSCPKAGNTNWELKVFLSSSVKFSRCSICEVSCRFTVWERASLEIYKILRYSFLSCKCIRVRVSGCLCTTGENTPQFIFNFYVLFLYFKFYFCLVCILLFLFIYFYFCFPQIYCLFNVLCNLCYTVHFRSM